MRPQYPFLILCSTLGLGAIFSVGHQNTDEHFQILEFASAFLNLTSTDSLPIEFQFKLRPTLQPMLVAGLFKFFQATGVGSFQNPFVWASGLRWIQVVFGGALLIWFLKTSKTTSSLHAAWITALTWYWPSLFSRHSSETATVLALMASFLCFSGTRFLWAGLFAAFAFWFRFQSGIVILSGAFWLLFISPRRFIPNATLVGVFLGFVLGLISDRVFYGEWVLTPWRYFHFNFFEAKLLTQDTSPFWDYFRRSFTEAFPVLGSIQLGAFLWFWFKNPKSVWTFLSLPFFLTHCLIGHKETRFLFVLLSVAPWINVEVFSPLFRSHRRWAMTFAVLSGVGLIIQTLSPAWPNYLLLKTIYYKDPTLPLFTIEQSPYWVSGQSVSFYRNPKLKVLPIHTLQEAFNTSSDFYLTQPCGIGGAQGCKLQASSLPLWSEAFFFTSSLHERIWKSKNNLCFYECRKP